MYRLRILHISDLHERGSRESEQWRRRRVLGPAWEDNLTELLQDGAIDLVCFTGDAADWGKDEEFTAAADFLGAICERVGVPLERLFVIPGNHDVNRKVREDVWKNMRLAIRSGADPQDVSRWING